MLTQFTQPTILKQIGPIRLAKFFEGFAEELKASNIVLPTMDYEKDNDFPGLAAALVPAERLPDRLFERPCSPSKRPPPRKTMIVLTRPPTADSPASASRVPPVRIPSPLAVELSVHLRDLL